MSVCASEGGANQTPHTTSGEHMFAINKPFIDIISGNKQFIIPVFQRDFSWTQEQCQQFWSDVTRASGLVTNGSHFIGSIVYVAAERSNAAFQRWLLIDGQQRMCTLTLLMVALRDHIHSTGWSGTDDGPTVKKIDAYYLKNKNESGKRQFKLMLRRKDNSTLQALVNGTAPSDLGNECSELLVDAYEYFRGVLCTPNVDPETIYHGIARLNVVDVTLDRNIDNPQLVFESMNSTGVDLRQSDLVRNFLLMGLNESEQTRLFDEYWSKIESLFRTSGNAFDGFLRDYLALIRRETKQVRADRIYDEFKTFWNQDESRRLERLLADMNRIARSYASFLGIAPMQRPWLADAMSHMRSLNTTQALLVMRLYDYHQQDQLSNDEFIKAIELIESYLTRRAVLGMQTRGYWSVFARIAHDLNSDLVLESLQVSFARLRGNYRFPNDEEFVRGLREHDLYNLRVCKHILERLENAGYREPSPVQDYSIEHIMPQDITNSPEWQEMIGENFTEDHPAWVHRLGNLTLTAYNSTYSNRPFELKKNVEGGFRHSAVRLNEDIRDELQWTIGEIQQRADRLANRALGIWRNHEADTESIQAADIRDLKELAGRRDVGELEMEPAMLKVLDEIRSRIRELVDVIEVVERKSICCYGPEFFVELLPKRHAVRLILPLEYSEVDIPEDVIAHDASTQKFVTHRVNTDSDLLVDVRDVSSVTSVLPMIRQALDQTR